MGGNSGNILGPSLGGSALSGPVAHRRAASLSTVLTILRCPVRGLISSVVSRLMWAISSLIICSLVSVVIVAIGGLIWIDSARLASPSSSVVFPGAPDSMVGFVCSLPASSSSSVDGVGVLGGSSSGPTCPAVHTSSSKMSHR